MRHHHVKNSSDKIRVSLQNYMLRDHPEPRHGVILLEIVVTRRSMAGSSSATRIRFEPSSSFPVYYLGSFSKSLSGLPDRDKPTC